MLKRLDKWVLKHFVTAAALVTVILMGLYVVGDVSEHIEEFSGGIRRYGWFETCRLIAGCYAAGITRYFFEFPDLVFSGTAAVLMVRLLQSGEAAVVQGLGRSLHRLLSPAVFATVLVGILTLAAGETIVPYAVMGEERARVRLVGGKPLSGVAFPAENVDAVVGVGYAGEEGRVSDMVVLQRMDDDRGKFEMVKVPKASWSREGQLCPEGEVERLVVGARREPSYLGHDAPLHSRFGETGTGALSVAPAAALKLRLLGPAALRIDEAFMLGGGRMLAEVGARFGGVLLLVGAVLLTMGLLAQFGGSITAGHGVAVFLIVEVFTRMAEAVAGVAGAYAPAAWAVAVGLSAGLIVVGAGILAFTRMPT